MEARVVVNRLLTTVGSDKEVRHYEIDLTGSEIDYSAGDSIAVHASNDPVLVDAILTELGVEPDRTVADYDEPLGTLLAHSLEIRTPSRALHPLLIKAMHARYLAIKVFLDEGINVISDDLVWTRDWLVDFLRIFEGDEVWLAGIHVSDKEGARSEVERGDRIVE